MKLEKINVSKLLNGEFSDVNVVSFTGYGPSDNIGRIRETLKFLDDSEDRVGHQTLKHMRWGRDGRIGCQVTIKCGQKSDKISFDRTARKFSEYCKRNHHNFFFIPEGVLAVHKIDANREIMSNSEVEDDDSGWCDGQTVPSIEKVHQTAFGIIEINPYIEAGVENPIYTTYKGGGCVSPSSPLSIYFYLMNDAVVVDFDACLSNLVSPILDECVVVLEDSGDSAKMHYVNISQYGNWNTTDFEVKRVDCELKDNYNDDLDYDKITSFINSKDSGIVILHGKPGTGKTTLIRKLIWDNRNRPFFFMDKSVFSRIADASFISFLLDIRNAVIVFEDCEDMIRSRDSGNSMISTILNISDGILGDTLGFKFIFTFNANLVDIDEALLRKGRTKYIYKFNELSADKTERLLKKIGAEGVFEGKPMVLTDIYNFNESNNSDKAVEKYKKAGF